MDLELIYALILTVLPFIELRLGLPLALNYALEQNIPIALVFCMIVLLNILLIFFIFFFLDNLHHVFMKNSLYKKGFEKYLKLTRKRVNSFQKKHESLGFLALVLFVAVPLPGTGAWSGSILSWILGLDRKKSVLSIALGVIIAGVIILFTSLSLFSFFK